MPDYTDTKPFFSGKSLSLSEDEGTYEFTGISWLVSLDLKSFKLGSSYIGTVEEGSTKDSIVFLDEADAEDVGYSSIGGQPIAIGLKNEEWFVLSRPAGVEDQTENFVFMGLPMISYLFDNKWYL